MGQVLEFIKGLPFSKRISLLVVLLATIGLILYAVRWGQKVGYMALYRDLPPEDVSAVLSYLKHQKIPFQLDPATGSIMVPVDKVYELRMELAAKGIPSGGKVGFEIFDKPKLGVGEFVQKVNYRRALEGELARSIMKLDGVQDVRVHIVLPKDSPFVGERIKAQASVVVKTKAGRSLSEEEVEAIRHLVASAVEGLDPEGVDVVDSKGRLLSKRREGPFGVTSEHLDLQRQWERSLEEKLIGLLEPVVGQGRVVARVSSDWDWRQVRQEQELYQSEPVVRARQITEETSAGASLAQGIPGVASNLGTRSYAGTAGLNLQRRTETTNYEVGKSVLQVVEPFGKLKRVAVAVVVDGKYVSQKEGEEPRFVPLSQEELSRIEEMVKSAVGFDPQRGDQVTVQCLPFQLPKEEEEAAPVTVGFERFLPLLRYLVPLLVVLLVFFLVLRPLLRGVLQKPAPVEMALPAPEAREELPKPTAPPLAEATLRLAREDVDYTLGMIRKWLKEGRGGR